MYIIEPLSQHQRRLKSEFSCGKPLLDTYLKSQAGQDIRRKLTACFLLIDKDAELIQGYYTLANHSIALNLVPEGFKKHLPASYTSVPATLLGRLAVDNRYKGMGIGKTLLIDALKKSYEVSKTIGSFAIVVDPLDEDTSGFYAKYGFITLPDSQKMFLPMKTIAMLFDE